jgi:hypothetical protein
LVLILEEAGNTNAPRPLLFFRAALNPLQSEHLGATFAEETRYGKPQSAAVVIADS